MSKSALAALLPRRMFMVSGPRRKRVVYLTFDDGPHPVHTPRLLDLLRALRIPATFFLIGQNMQRHPDLVRRMVAEGHAVGHHTFHHHPGLRQASANQLMREIHRTDSVFRDILGVTSRLFRPPWGKVTATQLGRLWLDGRVVVLWNVDPKDGNDRPSETIRTWFRQRPVRAGDIVLMHDDHPHAIDVLPGVVTEAQRSDLGFQALVP